MPSACVKPHGKRGKTDAADAEAIREAVTRPAMRFVPVTSAARQAALPDHEARDFPVRRRTRTVNAIRAHPAEFGIVVAKGIHSEAGERSWMDPRSPAERPAARGGAGRAEAARPALERLAGRLGDLEERIEATTTRITAARKADPLARRLASIHGPGPIASSAFAATTPDVAAFRSARDHAAWPGLTPKARSSGGEERPGRIGKAGNGYLRRLLHLGAMACISARHGRRVAPTDQAPDWLDRMLARKPVKVVAIALAARTVRALIARGSSYRAMPSREAKRSPPDASGGPEMVRRSVR